jgi:hypothetical protein
MAQGLVYPLSQLDGLHPKIDLNDGLFPKSRQITR